MRGAIVVVVERESVAMLLAVVVVFSIEIVIRQEAEEGFTRVEFGMLMKVTI